MKMCVLTGYREVWLSESQVDFDCCVGGADEGDY